MPTTCLTARLRWTIKPGNDLFIIWNRGWKRLVLTPEDISLVPDSELFAVKLRWTPKVVLIARWKRWKSPVSSLAPRILGPRPISTLRLA